jgi:hypothetical protein
MSLASESVLRAKLCSLRSPEIDLDSEYPSDPDCFIVLVEAEIGAHGVVGSELFRIHVCTPKWLLKELASAREVWGHGLLIVNAWNGEQVRLTVEAICSRTSAASWNELAVKLSRFAEWEFEGVDI